MASQPPLRPAVCADVLLLPSQALRTVPSSEGCPSWPGLLLMATPCHLQSPCYLHEGAEEDFPLDSGWAQSHLGTSQRDGGAGNL